MRFGRQPGQPGRAGGARPAASWLAPFRPFGPPGFRFGPAGGAMPLQLMKGAQASASKAEKTSDDEEEEEEEEVEIPLGKREEEQAPEKPKEKEVYEVGAGNFLYAEEYLKKHPEATYKATEYFSREEAESNWPGTRERLARLRERRGFSAQFRVDARDLARSGSPTRRRKIVWNSPFASTASKGTEEDDLRIVGETEKLLSEFLTSAKDKAPEKVKVGAFRWPHVAETSYGRVRPSVDFAKLAKETGWSLRVKPYKAPGSYAPVRTIGGSFNKRNLDKSRPNWRWVVFSPPSASDAGAVTTTSSEEPRDLPPIPENVRRPFKPPGSRKRKEGPRLGPPLHRPFRGEGESEEARTASAPGAEPVSGGSPGEEEETRQEVFAIVLSLLEARLQRMGPLAVPEGVTAEGLLAQRDYDFNRELGRLRARQPGASAEEIGRQVYEKVFPYEEI